MLFTFDGEYYGPSLSIDKAFVAYVRGQSDAAGFKTVSQPGFEYLSGYVEFWLRFIGVRSVVTLTVADKSRLSEAMLEAQVAAGYHRADRFHNDIGQRQRSCASRPTPFDAGAARRLRG
jgi:hypothetical protein